MTLLAILLAIAGHRPGATPERITSIIEEVQTIAHAEAGPFEDEAGNVAAVLAVMAHESGFDARIERCETPWIGANDVGTSWGMGQVKEHWFARLGLNRASLCASRAAQIRATLYVLRLYRGYSPQRVFQGYNAGSPRLTTGAARRTFHHYQRIRASL